MSLTPDFYFQKRSLGLQQRWHGGSWPGPNARGARLPRGFERYPGGWITSGGDGTRRSIVGGEHHDPRRGRGWGWRSPSQSPSRAPQQSSSRPSPSPQSPRNATRTKSRAVCNSFQAMQDSRKLWFLLSEFRTESLIYYFFSYYKTLLCAANIYF